MTSITLGTVEFEAIDQPHAYLIHELSGFVDGLLGSGVDLDDTTGIVRFFGDGMYGILAVFYPDLEKRLPPHEFAGFPSVSAFEAGEYDREYARKTPTFPQIVAAFEAAVEVNGGDYFRKVLGLVDPKLLRATLTEATAGYLSRTSPSSPPTSGASDLTSSGDDAPRSVSTIAA
jgi:hypothetical protein